MERSSQSLDLIPTEMPWQDLKQTAQILQCVNYTYSKLFLVLKLNIKQVSEEKRKRTENFK